MGAAGFQAVVGRQGAAEITLDLVARYLYPGGGRKETGAA